MQIVRFLQSAVMGLGLLHGSASWAAGVVNGSFEGGSFAGWNVAGTASIAYQGSIHAPLAGSYSALLVNTNGGSGCISPEDVWNCLPPPMPFVPEGGPAVTNRLGPDNAFAFIRGSYMAQDLLVDAGQVLSFDYRFIHPDVDGIRFLAVGPSGWQMSTVVGATATPSFTEVSGLFSYRFQQSGLWTVYIGTYQTEDPRIYSVAEIDNVALQAVPEPASGTLALLAAGLYGLLARRARARDAN